MQTFKVYQSGNTRESMCYHADSERDGDTLIKRLLECGQYNYVATVECDTLEQAYIATNSIHQSWIENHEILYLADAIRQAGGCRSTSVGDIITADGEAFIVAAFGFEPLGKIEELSPCNLS